MNLERIWERNKRRISLVIIFGGAALYMFWVDLSFNLGLVRHQVSKSEFAVKPNCAVFIEDSRINDPVLVQSDGLRNYLFSTYGNRYTFSFLPDTLPEQGKSVIIHRNNLIGVGGDGEYIYLGERDGKKLFMTLRRNWNMRTKTWYLAERNSAEFLGISRIYVDLRSQLYYFFMGMFLSALLAGAIHLFFMIRDFVLRGRRPIDFTSQ